MHHGVIFSFGSAKVCSPAIFETCFSFDKDTWIASTDYNMYFYIDHRSIFKTALLVYKFLNCGHPKYFAPFLKPRQSVYNTRKSQADGVFLEVPHFATSIYKSSKHFGLSFFAYDAPKIWNDLPDDVRSATSLHSFRRKLKTYLFAQAYPP